MHSKSLAFSMAIVLGLAVVLAAVGFSHRSAAVAAPAPVWPASFSSVSSAAPVLSQAGSMELDPSLDLVGKKAPNFATRTLQRRPLTLASLRGHVVLLDFWATWCGPCRMATPTIEKLYRVYHPHGLDVVGISVDQSDSVAQVPAFVHMMHMTYTIAVDPKANAKTASIYEADGIPAQYLINKEGKVVWAQQGYSPMEGPMLSAKIKHLLAEKS